MKTARPAELSISRRRLSFSGPWRRTSGKSRRPSQEGREGLPAERYVSPSRVRQRFGLVEAYPTAELTDKGFVVELGAIAGDDVIGESGLVLGSRQNANLHVCRLGLALGVSQEGRLHWGARKDRPSALPMRDGLKGGRCADGAVVQSSAPAKGLAVEESQLAAQAEGAGGDEDVLGRAAQAGPEVMVVGIDDRAATG
jgi:hypothetical protein